MPKAVKSDSTPTPTTGRRRFAGALSSIGLITAGSMGACIAAPIVQSLVDNSDADLIQLCAEFISLEAGYYACYEGADEVSDKEMGVRTAPIVARMDVVVDLMEAARATTADGIVARARTLAAHNGDFASSFDFPNTWTGRQLNCLLRDAAAIGVASS